MTLIKRLFYKLTSWFPRKLPRNSQEFEHMKKVLVEVYGVPNESPEMIMVMGQIVSLPASKIRKSWGELANAAKRLAINNIAMGYKNQEMQALNNKLQAAVEAHLERTANAESPSQVEPQTDAKQEPETGQEATTEPVIP